MGWDGIVLGFLVALVTAHVLGPFLHLTGRGKKLHTRAAGTESCLSRWSEEIGDGVHRGWMSGSCGASVRIFLQDEIDRLLPCGQTMGNRRWATDGKDRQARQTEA